MFIMFLIETKPGTDINLAELGDVVLDGIVGANEHLGTDFRRIAGSCWPTLLKSTDDYAEWAVGRLSMVLTRPLVIAAHGILFLQPSTSPQEANSAENLHCGYDRKE
jgi:hypothetical protein